MRNHSHRNGRENPNAYGTTVLHVIYKQVRPLAALASLRGAPRPAYGRPPCAMLENSLTNTPLVNTCH